MDLPERDDASLHGAKSQQISRRYVWHTQQTVRKCNPLGYFLTCRYFRSSAPQVHDEHALRYASTETAISSPARIRSPYADEPDSSRANNNDMVNAIFGFMFQTLMHFFRSECLLKLMISIFFLGPRETPLIFPWSHTSPKDSAFPHQASASRECLAWPHTSLPLAETAWNLKRLINASPPNSIYHTWDESTKATFPRSSVPTLPILPSRLHLCPPSLPPNAADEQEQPRIELYSNRSHLTHTKISSNDQYISWPHQIQTWFVAAIHTYYETS